MTFHSWFSRLRPASKERRLGGINSTATSTEPKKATAVTDAGSSSCSTGRAEGHADVQTAALEVHSCVDEVSAFVGAATLGPLAEEEIDCDARKLIHSSTGSAAMKRASSNASQMSSMSSAQLDFLTFPATKSKGPPTEATSSRCITEEVLLPPMRWADTDLRSLESDSSISFFKMVPAPAPVPSPVYLSLEKGAAQSVCEANAQHAAAIIGNHLDKAADPALDDVLQLACSVFGSEAAAITLLGSDRYFVTSGMGGSCKQIGQSVPWLSAMCGYTLAPQQHEVVVVEDMLQDARFNVGGLTRWPFERFYCGCPLVSANGYRVGTLCLGGHKPRTMTAHEVNILCNMAEVVVRLVEASWAQEAAQAATATKLSRALSAYTVPLLFMDTGAASVGPARGWRVLYLNGSAAKLLGVTKEEVTMHTLEDLFPGGSSTEVPWTVFQKKAAAGLGFVMRAMHARSLSEPFTLTFRSAALDAVDDQMQAVGIPSFILDSKDGFLGRYFFVELTKTTEIKTLPQPLGLELPAQDVALRQDSCESGSSGGALQPEVPEALRPHLRLGPILGSGSYGRVYRGIYRNQRIAVKVLSNEDVKWSAEGQPLEAVLTEGLRHRGIMQTIAHCVTSRPQVWAVADEEESQEQEQGETWLLLEYCDRGCLQDAVDKGALRGGKKTQYDPADMAKVIAIACDIAEGISYLHEHDVVHGDLSGGNVMLARDNSAIPGFCGKIGDFGLARNFQMQSRIQTRMYGTVSHIPPEMMESGIASKAVDVFAAGVLMWEMYHGSRAWAGMSLVQIMHAVMVRKERLTFTREGLGTSCIATAQFIDLAESCLSRDPAERPLIGTVAADLARLRSIIST